jgi:hypothetical protein
MRNVAAASLALAMVSAIPVLAQAEPVERLTFARPPAPESTIDPKDRLAIVIDRWSSDAERDRLSGTLAEEGAQRLLDALGDSPGAGRLHWPGGLEYGIRYARRVSRDNGELDVVLILDRPLWVWWDARGTLPKHDDPFTVVHLRLGKDGRGEGRVSTGVAVRSDKAVGVALADHASAPVLLTDVRRASS